MSISDIPGKFADRFKGLWAKSSAKEALDSKSPKKKGRVLKIVAVVALVGLLVTLMMSREQRQLSEISKKETADEISYATEGLDKNQLEETLFQTAMKDVSELKREVKELRGKWKTLPKEIKRSQDEFRAEHRERMQELNRESIRIHRELEDVKGQLDDGQITKKVAEEKVKKLVEERNKIITEKERAEKTASKKKKKLEVKPAYSAEYKGEKPEPVGKSVPKTPVPPAPPQFNNPQGPQAPGGAPNQQNPNGTPGMAYAGLIHMDIETPSNLLGAVGRAVKKNTEAEIIPVQDVIPASSFFRCTLLSGVDAVTGLKAQNQPQIAILKVNGKSNLPNKFKQDTRGCHIIAEVFGSISEERAYFRTTKLTCIKKDGSIIDSEMQGHVFGEDGSIGVRGPVRSRKGAFLARRLLASFLEGAAAFLSTSNTQVDNYLGGTTTTVDRGKAFEAGFGEGVSNAMEDLSESYKKMADEIYYTIEIASGRQVHVATISETDLTPTKKLAL